MYKNKYFIIIFLLLFASIQNLQAQKGEKYKIKKVVIDAGHGGKDPGAIGKIAYEKDICLSISLILGSYIEKYMDDVEVIYTRTTDEFVELHRRAEIANENKADLFISIHVNSTRGHTAYGTSTYVMGLHKSDENMEVATTENSVILQEANYRKKYAGFEPDSPETYIILNLYQNAHLEQSLLLAQNIQDQFENRAGRKNGGVRQAGLLVLWKTTMPSVLVETGFISNRNEEKFLNSTYGQEIIASAIFRAFRDYKNEVELQNKDFNISPEEKRFQRKKRLREEKRLRREELRRINSVNYYVQIKSSDKKISLSAREFKGIENVEEKLIDGMYKYVAGKTSDYNQILKTQTEIRKKIPEAFVVAFYKDEKISVSEARKIQKGK